MTTVNQTPTSAVQMPRLGSECTCPQHGSWVSKDDQLRNLRDLDIALNGPDGTATNPALCDIVGQVCQAATQKANQWMPIADAPKTGEWIIVYDSAGNVHPDYWLGRGMDQWAKEPHDEINTHWQPLPLPPTVAQPQGRPL